MANTGRACRRRSASGRGPRSALADLDDRQDVAGRVLEPGDERAALAVDPLGIYEVVMFELDSAGGERVDRGLDVVYREVEDGERGRRVVRLGVDDRVPPAGNVQGEHSVLLGDRDTECLAVELPGRRDVAGGEPAECLGVLEHHSSSLGTDLRRWVDLLPR